MSMHIAILAFVASFAAITGWLIIRAPADHSADHAEALAPEPTSPPAENKSIQESEPASDEVIALSDTERLIRSMLNKLVIPVIDLENAPLEEALNVLALEIRELDPQQKTLRFIIKQPQDISTDSLEPEVTLPDPQQITIYEENITPTKALNLICEMANCRWEITDHSITLTYLN